MTAADFLARIEARANAATEGPWRVGVEGSEGSRVNPDTGDKRTDARALLVCNGRVQPEDGRNAEFIAHARADVPALVAALRAVLDLHKPGVGASQGYLPGGDYGYVEPYCAGCVHSDEYAQQWPCQTARAVATALGVNPS